MLEWTSGKLFFDELPLPEVVKILERSYDVHITFATDSLREFRFMEVLVGVNKVLKIFWKH